MRSAMNSKVLLSPKFRYSHVVKAGSFYYCSGMLALDNETGTLVDGGPGAETAKILDNAGLLMQEFGLIWNNLVIARIFTSEFDKFDAINEAWEKVFDKSVIPPARTSVGVAALPMGASVEIEFTYYKVDPDVLQFREHSW